MNKKAQNVIEAYPRIESAAVRAIIVYASQNPGFDAADYGFHPGMRQSDVASARSAYAADSRRASAQWRDVVAAAHICAYARVTDLDVIEACRNDRLSLLQVRDSVEHVRMVELKNKSIELQAIGQKLSDDDRKELSMLNSEKSWNGAHADDLYIHYTAGQYAPTEYRQACARVLEYAARLAHNRTEPLADAMSVINSGKHAEPIKPLFNQFERDPWNRLGN